MLLLLKKSILSLSLSLYARLFPFHLLSEFEWKMQDAKHKFIIKFL